MADNILPSIGMRGIFQLKAPFNQLQMGNIEYTCRAIRSIGHYISLGEDVLTKIYTPVGLTHTDYLLDLEADVLVLSLQADSSNWLVVPASYVLSYPDPTGIPYHLMMLGVNLGSMEVDLDLHSVEESIKNVVYDQLGVIPVIKQVELSQIAKIPNDQHIELVKARQSRISVVMSDAARCRALEIQLESALGKIKALEAFLVNAIKTGKCKSTTDPEDIIPSRQSLQYTHALVYGYLVDGRYTITARSMFILNSFRYKQNTLNHRHFLGNLDYRLRGKPLVTRSLLADDVFDTRVGVSPTSLFVTNSKIG